MSRLKKAGTSCLYCDDVAKSLGMCSKHYQRYRKYGDPHHVIRARKAESTCLYCDDVANSLGMCSKHYQRYRKYGDPHHVIRPRKADISGLDLPDPVPAVKSETLDSKVRYPTPAAQQMVVLNSMRIGISSTRRTTGIVRKLDELGRIVLPREFATTQSIHPGVALEIYVTEDQIALKKYAPGCILCGSLDNLIHFKEKLICDCCISESKVK